MGKRKVSEGSSNRDFAFLEVCEQVFHTYFEKLKSVPNTLRLLAFDLDTRPGTTYQTSRRH